MHNSPRAKASWISMATSTLSRMTLTPISKHSFFGPLLLLQASRGCGGIWDGQDPHLVFLLFGAGRPLGCLWPTTHAHHSSAQIPTFWAYSLFFDIPTFVPLNVLRLKANPGLIPPPWASPHPIDRNRFPMDIHNIYAICLSLPFLGKKHMIIVINVCEKHYNSSHSKGSAHMLNRQ